MLREKGVQSFLRGAERETVYPKDMWHGGTIILGYLALGNYCDTGCLQYSWPRLTRDLVLKDQSNSQVSDNKYILDECVTFWGERERLHVNKMEKLHAHDCHQKSCA